MREDPDPFLWKGVDPDTFAERIRVHLRRGVDHSDTFLRREADPNPILRRSGNTFFLIKKVFIKLFVSIIKLKSIIV